MKIYDISVPITENTITWPGDPKITIKSSASIKNGDPANISEIKMSSHTGTHIDAPNHFIDSGKTIDTIPLNTFISDCIVIEINTTDSIKQEDIAAIDLKEHTHVLFKTSNSNLWEKNSTKFDKDFVALNLSGAEYLIEQGVKFIGIDYLSIESFYADEKNPVHSLLLKNNIVILEDLNLSGIEPGLYELICLPLKLEKTDGSPCRAILRKE